MGMPGLNGGYDMGAAKGAAAAVGAPKAPGKSGGGPNTGNVGAGGATATPCRNRAKIAAPATELAPLAAAVGAESDGVGAITAVCEVAVVVGAGPAGGAGPDPSSVTRSSSTSPGALTCACNNLILD